MTGPPPRGSSPRCLAAALVLAPGTSNAQPQLQPLDRPRTDDYEQPVQEQLRAAREALDRLLDEPGTDRLQLAAAFGHMGQLYLVYDFWRIARTALRNAETLDPTDARWPYFQAIANTYDGNDEGTVAALDRVLELVPDDLAARTRRAYALQDLGRFDEAAEECRRILELDPNNSAALVGLGRVEFEAGSFERAIEHFREALDGQPEGSAIHHRIGLALRRLGRREEAADHLARNQQIPVSYQDRLLAAMQALNVSRSAFFSRGAEAMRTGNPRLALAAFEAALRASPDDPETVFNVAMALIDLDDKPGAEERLREAIALDPDYREPRFNLALMLAERDDLEEAERHFGRATEIDPDDLDARTRWGRNTGPPRPDRRSDRGSHRRPGGRRRSAGGPARPRRGPTRPKATSKRPGGALNRVLKAAPGALRERSEAHYRLAALLEAEATGSGQRTSRRRRRRGRRGAPARGPGTGLRLR